MKLAYLLLVSFALFGLLSGTDTNEEQNNSESEESPATYSDHPQPKKQSDSSKETKTDIVILDDETEEKSDDIDKRFGFVLGNGFSSGKRFGSVLGNGMSFGKRYGSVLGNGIGFGKRFGSVLGNGMSFGKRFGSFLGRGFNFGKRDQFGIEDGDKITDSMQFSDSEDSKRDGENKISEDIELVDLVGPVDEKRWILNDIYGGGFPGYKKRSKRDTRSKRYFHYYGNMLGRGFSMGKRNDKDAAMDGEEFTDEIEDKEIDPNLALQTNSMFGRYQRRFGRFGSVLGRGFSFGKRSFNEDSEFDNDIDSRMMNSELDPEEIENAIQHVNNKRYFMSSPGYRFGKRDGADRNKRLSFILGRGLFGKRLSLPSKDKHPYGFVLGRGYSFGKRSPEYTDDAIQADVHYPLSSLENIDQDLMKRSNFVLGRGYPYGKRGSKRFGWVLGNGFTFGKRDATMGNDGNTVSLFLDNSGTAFVRIDLIENFDKIESDFLYKTTPRVFACAGELVSHQSDNPEELLQKSLSDTDNSDETQEEAEGQDVSYFIDDAGYIYVKADDILEKDEPLVGTVTDISYSMCEGFLIEVLDNENISKREWGNILGRGFQFGKRKRFGHILGNGLSFSW